MKKKDGADESEDKTACVPVLHIKRRKPVWKQECSCPAWNIILPAEAGTAFRFSNEVPAAWSDNEFLRNPDRKQLPAHRPFWTSRQIKSAGLFRL